MLKRFAPFSFCKIHQIPLSHPLLSSRVLAIKHNKDGCHQERRMFSQQTSLDRLPVPPLHQTLSGYLRCVEHLVEPHQFQRTSELVQKFGETNGEGERLQSLLQKKAGSSNNWLAEWWLRVAYLDYRASVVINSNPGIKFPQQTFKSEEDWLFYTAKFVSGVLDYKRMINTQTLPVDMAGDKPLCMMQFYSTLCSCRIPGSQSDTIHCYRPDAGGVHIKHICVMHRNRLFSVDVMDDHMVPLSLPELYSRISAVVHQSEDEGHPIGLLTSEHRDNWARTYQRLIQNPDNLASLVAIQKSMFLLCLDDIIFPGVSKDQQDSISALNMLHGLGVSTNSGNRWFDKTIQFIFTRDGACGLNYEHAPAEGPPVISIVDHALGHLVDLQDQAIPPIVASGDPSDGVSELIFHLDADTKADINKASNRLDKAILNLDLVCCTFEKFGKSLIKENRLSPDAFFQVALQLAYLRLHGVPCATYESGSMRQFQLGRTDTIRSSSKESFHFSKAMQDASCSWEERLSLMVNAISQHRAISNQVITGNGIDRHLLGLKLISVEHGLEIPQIFTDPSYLTAMHFNLSTSQVASKEGAVLCFGPVVPDGYGVCYNPMPSSFVFCVSSYGDNTKTDCESLAEEVNKALMDMRDLLNYGKPANFNNMSGASIPINTPSKL